MERTSVLAPSTIRGDLVAGVVVFLVALPLCLGIPLASDAPVFSGIVAGVVGGILVGIVSGSHTSICGPSAGMAAIVAAQMALLGSFEAFLLAVVIGGLVQIALGLARAGFISAFFPSSVIKGLLAAIGVILILKQIPHVLGHDSDPEGDMAFVQPDHQNTLSEFVEMIGDLHPGAAVIGLLSIVALVGWARSKSLSKSVVPAPLVVVLSAVGISLLFDRLGGRWAIAASHLVQVPAAGSTAEFLTFLKSPDFSQWSNPTVYLSGLMLGLVASLEMLVNLEAVDRIDPRGRISPPNRELVAQGIGNVVCGLIGGIPMTSVIVRGSVNINAGGRTKLAAIAQGALLLVCVLFLPEYLGMIPLACLGAILLVTGVKLASPALMKEMWNEGRYQFVPFIVTLLAIVLTDLVTGILIGMAVSLSFILNSNFRRPIRRIVEKHPGGDVLRIELANQVSFLNRAALEKTLRAAPRGSHVLLDAEGTDYIDPDILSLIREFKERTGPIRGVQVSLRGFRDRYRLRDEIQFVDYSNREIQGQLTPDQVLRILREGNERFRSGQRITRDLGRQRDATARGQHPLAVVLSCIDSRTPAELVFDLGLGDIFSVRVAGNVTSDEVLGSMEYGCAVTGAKLVLVMGHTRCGAVTAAVQLTCSAQDAAQSTGCQHLGPIVAEIRESVEESTCEQFEQLSPDEKSAACDAVAARNVRRVVRRVVEQSKTLGELVRDQRVAIVGAMYDVTTGKIAFFSDDAGAPDR